MRLAVEDEGVVEGGARDSRVGEPALLDEAAVVGGRGLGVEVVEVDGRRRWPKAVGDGLAGDAAAGIGAFHLGQVADEPEQRAARCAARPARRVARR